MQDAYETIQTEQDNWLFRTKQGTLNCTPNGTFTFSKATIQGQIADFDRNLYFVFPSDSRYLLSYANSAGVQSAAYCYYIPYQRWRGWRDRGVLPSGQPQYFTELPDGQGGGLQFYPIPDTGDVTNANTYRILLDYYITPATLTADADIPILPPEFHKAIAWLAIMRWATVRQDSVRYQLASKEYEIVLNDMRHSQLPEQLLGLTEFFG